MSEDFPPYGHYSQFIPTRLEKMHPTREQQEPRLAQKKTGRKIERSQLEANFTFQSRKEMAKKNKEQQEKENECRSKGPREGTILKPGSITAAYLYARVSTPSTLSLHTFLASAELSVFYPAAITRNEKETLFILE